MRLSVLLLFFFASQIVQAQTVNKKSALVSPTYAYLKYSISFADQVQIAYDGTDLKQSHFMPPSVVEVADIDYYNGKYGNAAGEFYSVMTSLPKRADITGKELWKSSFSLYRSTMELVDHKGLNEDDVRLYTSAANTAGMLYQTRGKFAYAEAMLDRALSVRAQRLGKTSREYINSLCNVAVLHKDLGNYDEAEKLFNYLSKTIPKLFTTHSVQYAILLNNRAMLLAELGRTKEAIQLLDEALIVGKEVFSDLYIDYERVLTNRALIEQESGSLVNAETYYKSIIERMNTKGFEDHPDYNNVLVYYGSLRVLQNDETVLEFLTDVSNKVKKRYGENHPLLAKAQSNLGDYYLNKQSYASAKSIFEKVAAIQLKVLGESHKDYLNTLIKLAICEWYLNDNQSAAVNFKKAIKNYMFLLNSFFPSMSETEKSKFWRTLKPNVDTFLAFAISTGEANPGILVDAYNLHLKTKGLLFNSTNRTKAALLSSGDSLVTKLYSDWLDLKGTLASYYSAPLEDAAEDKIDIHALELRANELERDLSKKSQLFQSGYTEQEISFEKVKNSLQHDEVAVEIIRLSYLYGPNKGNTEYAGLVVTKDAIIPSLVRIKGGENLEKRSLAFYKNSIQSRVEESQSFDTYWKPFDALLNKHKKIFVSVDGVYNSINLNTLRRASGTYLLDEDNIILLPSTRLIAESTNMDMKLAGSAGLAVLMGSPNYGNQELINPLPGTKVEIEKIDALLHQQHVKTQVMMEALATEDNLKAVAHPSVLHIATHGFFLADVNTGSGLTMGVQISRAKENPLLRSGLLFSGAALAIGEGPTLSGGDNGILNAYEALNLDLNNTQLVIMSACETGTGEIVNGEGVYGLSRSFQVAGAKKIIMSLWKVDDEATQELMTQFYSSWTQNSNPQEAFITAQRAVKSKYSDPYYWGAFVLLN